MRTSRVWRGGRRRWTAHGALVLVFGLLISQFVTAHPASGASSTPSAPVFRRVATPNASTGPVVGISSDPAGRGYWLVTSRGRVFPEGPRYWGSVRTSRATGPIVGIAANPTGTGYWLATSRGHVYALGHTHNFGSAHTNPATGPIAGIAANPTGTGYWLVTKLGRVHAFGGAHSAAWVRIDGRTGPVVAITASPHGEGYWIGTSNARVFAIGGAPRYQGSARRLSGGLVVGLAPVVSRGYWIADRSAAVAQVPSVATAGNSSPATHASTTTSAPPSTANSAPAPIPPTTLPVGTTPPARNGPLVDVPSSIPHQCSGDATEQLNAFFAGLAPGSTVEFPPDGCYDVSPSVADTLAIHNVDNLVVNGNGSTLYQPSYLEADGVTNACGHNIRDSVLSMWSDAAITVTNLTVKGPVTPGSPYQCQGDLSEGDNGIYMGNRAVADGSSNITFDNVTIEDINGDALDLYPNLGAATAGGGSINTNIEFQNGTLSNWGWYAIVPEGVNGFTFTSNTVNGNGRFIDAEVDNACGMAPHWAPNHAYSRGDFVTDGDGGQLYQANAAFTSESSFNAADWTQITAGTNTPYTNGSYYASDCLGGTGTAPTGDGIWNMAIVDNSFANGATVFAEGPQGCIPEQNWTITGNISPNGLGVTLDGSHGDIQCARDNSGFVFSNNTGAGEPGPCGSSPTDPKPIGCAGIDLVAWANVTITNNALPYPEGRSGTLRTVTDGIVTSGSSTITSATADFTSADVGSYVTDSTLGLIGGTTTIASVTNSTTAVLTSQAKGSGTDQTLNIGTAGGWSVLLNAVGLCSVAGARVSNNDFSGAYSATGTNCFDSVDSALPTTGATTCGNDWGLVNTAPWWFYDSTGGPAPVNGMGYTGKFDREVAPADKPQSDSPC